MSQNELDKVLKAPEQQLRAILRAVCDDEDARKKAIKHYHALQEFVPIYTSTESAKRKAKSEVHICVQCDEPFLEEDNRFGDCYYHPGKTFFSFPCCEGLVTHGWQSIWCPTMIAMSGRTMMNDVMAQLIRIGAVKSIPMDICGRVVIGRALTRRVV